MNETVKKWLKNDSMFYTMLILLVGVVSFGLGRLSVQYEAVSGRVDVTPVTIIEPQISSVITADSSTATYVASKKGTKYHALTCPGAKQISEANKIFFQTVLEAKAAGYTLAGNCKE